MLTLKHITIYKSYNGDGDGFVRCASNEEKAYMSYKNWSLIEDFIQDIYLVKKGLVSEDFVENLYKKVHENCDSKETINELEQLATKK